MQQLETGISSQQNNTEFTIQNNDKLISQIQTIYKDIKFNRRQKNNQINEIQINVIPTINQNIYTTDEKISDIIQRLQKDQQRQKYQFKNEQISILTNLLRQKAILDFQIQNYLKQKKQSEQILYKNNQQEQKQTKLQVLKDKKQRRLKYMELRKEKERIQTQFQKYKVKNHVYQIKQLKLAYHTEIQQYHQQKNNCTNELNVKLIQINQNPNVAQVNIQKQTVSQNLNNEIEFNPQKLKQFEAFQQISGKIQNLVPQIQKIQKQSQKIIGIFGSTGSGKSTLISYLQNSSIMKYKKHFGGIYRIDHGDNTGKFPMIGHQMTSCTTIPAIYEFNKQSLVDLAGWFDTGSSSQQIINAFTNSSIFRRGKAVKIILLVEINSIFSSRGGNLVDIIQRLAQLFGQDLTLMSDSIILVLSKVNTDQCPQSFIIEQILEIMELNKNFPTIAKTLIKNLIRNQMIRIFPQPDKITDHIELIKQKLKNMGGTVLSYNANISLSNSAKNDINSYLNLLNEKICKCSLKVKQDIRRMFQNKKYLSVKQVNDDLSKLKKVGHILKTQIGQFKAAGAMNSVNFLQEVIKNVQVSPLTLNQLKYNFNSVAFYKCLNPECNIELSFIQGVSLEISQNINRIESIRSKIISEHQKQQMQSIQREQLKKRQQQNLRLIELAQKRMQAQLKQQHQRIQIQRKQHEQQMRRIGQQHAQQMRVMNEQLSQMSTRPQIVYYRNQDRGAGCQIM